MTFDATAGSAAIRQELASFWKSPTIYLLGGGDLTRGGRNWRDGGYIKRLSNDPWGTPYQYVFPGTHGQEYDLYSFGADSQEGGEGPNADIGNWALGQ